MGRFNALKTTIDANIRENGNQEITGEILNRVLNEMVSVTEEEVADAAASGGGGGADLTEVNKKIAELTEETERLEADKQDALVSGINIKTINGQNILGRGNIEIEGGSGGSSVEVVDSLDSEDTTAALSANQGRVLKEMIGQGGGGAPADLYPTEYSDEFNDDFTS